MRDNLSLGFSGALESRMDTTLTLSTTVQCFTCVSRYSSHRSSVATTDTGEPGQTVCVFSLDSYDFRTSPECHNWHIIHTNLATISEIRLDPENGLPSMHIG